MAMTLEVYPTDAEAFEAAAADLEPYVRLVKVDTEAESELSGRLNIRSIPTLNFGCRCRTFPETPPGVRSGSFLRWAISNRASV